MPLRLVLTLLLLSCCSPYGLPPASRAHLLPSRISELGLYSDLRKGTVVEEGLRAYRPSFALWSDGASKRRWIRLPSSDGGAATIDTSNMDSWRFPVGTELFKEFSVGGKRIETRVLRKVSAEDDGWAAMSFAWNEAQTEAVAAPDGIKDALGTKYDVPSARTCMACHGGRRERVLGFSAVQLAHEAKKDDAEGTSNEVTLDRLVAEHRLSAEPSAPIRVPGNPTDVAAIGYLHANCSHCHNSDRPKDATYFRPPATIDFALRVEDLGAVTSTKAHQTKARFVMGLNPAKNHLIVQRMTREGTYMRRMPPLATELIDAEGVAVVSAWLGAND